MDCTPAGSPPACLPKGPGLRLVTTALSQSENPPGTPRDTACLSCLPHGTDRHREMLDHFTVFDSRLLTYTVHYIVIYCIKCIASIFVTSYECDNESLSHTQRESSFKSSHLQPCILLYFVTNKSTQYTFTVHPALQPWTVWSLLC